MNGRSQKLRLPLLLAGLSVSATLLRADVADAACSTANASNPTSCGMGISAKLDQAMNPPSGEDAAFFASSGAGGRSSIAFLIDTSDTMRQLTVDLSSAAARTAAGADGCSNASVAALLYTVNRCVDSNGAAISPRPAWCQVAKPNTPVKWYQSFDSTYVYPPADEAVTDLFTDGKFYHLDEGWAADTTTVAAGSTYASAVAACVGATSTANCGACLGSKGYYSDPTATKPVALSGRFLNFFPPRYVMARKVVRDAIHQMDAAGNSRQAIFALAMGTGTGSNIGDDVMRCFGPTRTASGKTFYSPAANGNGSDGAGTDAYYDGARMIDNLFPPCGQFTACAHTSGSSTHPAAFFKIFGEGGTTNETRWLFRGPISADGTVAKCPLIPYTSWSVQSPDNRCVGTYNSAAASQAWWPAGATPFSAANGTPVTCAPLGEALLGVAQYFSQATGTGVTPRFDTVFPHPMSGTTGNKGDFRKTALDEGSGANVSVCAPGTCSCPRIATIVVAAGPPSFDDNLPQEITGITGPGSNFAKVAKYFARTMPGGLRPDGADKFSNLRMRTFVLGLGSNDASLVEAAKLGLGQFIPASNADELKTALANAVLSIQTGSASFSNSAVSAVQSRSGAGVLVPRFIPTQSALWEGHLNKYLLVSEDACGCTGVSGDPCDYNQDGACGGVFLKDKNNNFVVETSDGVFVKASLNTTTHLFDAATCAPGVSCDAEPMWDSASRVIAQTPANRRIYTVVDDSSSSAGVPDGKFDSYDTTIEFSEANADKLAAYMYTLGHPMCTQVSGQLNQCMDFVDCARVIIRYVRGEDVFDEDGDGNVTESRSVVLGDIFHSSPVVVDPPLPQNGALCKAGLHNQCLRSLFDTPTKLNVTAGASAYEQFRSVALGTRTATSLPASDRTNLTAQHRPRIALVGANDGMVHAFHNGSWHSCDSGTDQPTTCIADPGGDHTKDLGYFDRGTGDELWAFIPPDLLAKLPDLLDITHQYFVDATPMVREVWADKTGTSRDFIKQGDEFHTVAIIGERRGGTHFFALDVTDTRGPSAEAAGFFRWLYPQVFTREQVAAGYSYADFLPSPPPIGPIRLKTAAATTSTSTDVLTWTDGATKYEERWIAALNGGHDPLFNTGRSVSLVDAWYGGNGSDSAVPYKYFGPSCSLANLTAAETTGLSATAAGQLTPFVAYTPTIFQYPVASTVAMAGWGPNEKNPNMAQNNYFFDTAVVGDVGGQVFTLRFNNPDSTKWSGGRSMATSTTTDPTDRQPFFQIPSLVFTNPGGELRAALGSGDRYALRDATMGACSITNLLGCARRGCGVSSELERENFPGAATVSWSPTYTKGSTALAGCNLTPSQTFSATTCTSLTGLASTPEIERETKLTNCPGATSASIEVETELHCQVAALAATTGAGTANCKGCTQGALQCVVSGGSNDFSALFPGANSALAATAVPRSGFYTPLIFTPTTRPVLDTAAAAATYDAARLKACSSTNAGCTTTMVNIDPYLATPTVFGSDSAPGWYFLYGVTGSAHTGAGYNVLNERTATPSTVVGGCAMWSSMTPATTPGSCDNTSTSAATMYRLKLVEGSSCTGDGLSASLATSIIETKTVVPPPAPQVSVFVAPSGTVSVSIVELPRVGGKNVSATSVARDTDLVKTIQEVVVPRGMEACRHAADGTAAGANCETLR